MLAILYPLIHKKLHSLPEPQSYNVQNNIINTLHAYETCQNPSCDHFIVNFYRLRILRDNWCTLLWLELIM